NQLLSLSGLAYLIFYPRCESSEGRGAQSLCGEQRKNAQTKQRGARDTLRSVVPLARRSNKPLDPDHEVRVRCLSKSQKVQKPDPRQMKSVLALADSVLKIACYDP
ncbi:hypothetical protein H0E87_031540, partial [Populus deltoides]